MTTLRLIADLHFNHSNITSMSDLRQGSNYQEHDNWVIKQINSVTTKYDQTYILGDVSFSKEGLELLKRINGNKKLWLGNHDTFSNASYLKYFQKLYGISKEHGYWLSHAPIHLNSLRNRWNIHGHTHASLRISEPGYFCVSVEALNGVPMTFDQIDAEVINFNKLTGTNSYYA